MIFTRKSATISEDGTYRYTLEREWDDQPERLLFIMLNPSIAEAERNDHTINKCVKIANYNGYGGILVANLFALRSPHPSQLLLHRDPVGPMNDFHLTLFAETCEDVVAAWGTSATTHPLFQERISFVLDLFKDKLLCLKLTRKGYPTHPLARGRYAVPHTTIPQPWT